MTITIKYIGTADNYAELPVTGNQSVWQVGQQEERPDNEAVLLMATGKFSSLPVPVFASANVTGGSVFLAGGEEVLSKAIPAASVKAKFADSQRIKASADIRAASRGTLLTGWSGATVSNNGTAPGAGAVGLVTTDLAPGWDSKYALRLIGNAASRPTVTASLASVDTTEFRGIGVWLRIIGRKIGPATLQMWLGDGGFTNSLALTFFAPADGNWHFVHIPYKVFEVQGTFVLGTNVFTTIKINDKNDSSMGYPGMLAASEELQVGPVYMNPWSRPKFMIRFDDSLDDLVVPSATFTADGITKSWSQAELLQQYGFGDKGSVFHLTRRFDGGGTSKQECLTAAQLQQLADLGWSHCFQSHQDPADAGANGLRLMGPYGYHLKAVDSVTTGASGTINVPAKQFHRVPTTLYGGGPGCPVVFSGTDLPSPLVAGTTYWARYSTALAFGLFTTKDDSINNTSRINLTTAGTADNFKFRYLMIESVSTAANTISVRSTLPHLLIPVTTAYPYSGYPIRFEGTDLPAPLDVDTVYWARYVSTEAFTLHPTERDAVAGTNTIDLTTAGTVDNFTYRYAYSAPDISLMVDDFRRGFEVLESMGYGDTARIYAPNQGSIDHYVGQAAREAGVEMVLGIMNPGASVIPVTRMVHAETSGFVNAGINQDPFVTAPGAIQTDQSTTAQNVRDYVDHVIEQGGFGSNYHHELTATNGPVLAAYLDQLRTKVAAGECDVVTAAEWRDYLKAARSLVPGVVF